MHALLRRSVVLAATVSAAMLAACMWHETGARAASRAVEPPAAPSAAEAAAPPEPPHFDAEEPRLPLDDPPLPPRRVAGRVIFEDGRPAPRASLFDSFGSVDLFEAADDGRFAVELEPGWHMLTAHTDEEGYTGGCAHFTIPEDGLVPDVTITLKRVRYYWATVRVEEADGRPAANVRVEDERTDVEGRARLRFANDAEPHHLWLHEDGLVCAAAEATVQVADYDPGPETVVVLPPLQTIRIIVTGPGGATVPAATIQNVAAGLGNGSIDLPVVDGFHRISYRRWPEGGVRLYVSAEGFAFWCGSLRQPGESAEVRLQLPATVVGRLLDENGSPAAGREISCFGSATTDAEGRFRCEGLVPGWENEIRVFGSREGPGSYPFLVKHRVEIGPGEIRDVGDLKLPRLAPTPGRVIDRDGRPIAGAKVEARGGALRFGGDAESGPDGEFRLKLPDSQRWDLLVKRRGYCTLFAEGVEAEAGAPIELVLAPEGRVRVHTTTDYSNAWAELGEHRLDLECSRGQLKDLPAGPVRIHLVEHSGDVVSTREVDVVPGRIVDVDFP